MTIQLARKVDEANPPVLELNAEGFQLGLKAVDVARHFLDAALQRRDARIRKLGVHAVGGEVELDDGLLPPAVLADDVLDDLAYERKRAIGLVDGKKLL